MSAGPASIGMRTCAVMCGSANVASSSPVGSGPNSNTSPGRYPTSANDRSAWAVKANTRAPSTAAHAASNDGCTVTDARSW